MDAETLKVVSEMCRNFPFPMEEWIAAGEDVREALAVKFQRMAEEANETNKPATISRGG